MGEIEAKNIKSFREEHGWYQADLAKKLGVTDKAVSAWESGRVVPRLPMLMKMCDLFGCNLRDLTEARVAIKQYTYRRKLQGMELAAEKEGKEVPEPTIDDELIVVTYRRLSPEGRAAVLQNAVNLLNEELKKEEEKKRMGGYADGSKI